MLEISRLLCLDVIFLDDKNAMNVGSLHRELHAEKVSAVLDAYQALERYRQNPLLVRAHRAGLLGERGRRFMWKRLGLSFLNLDHDNVGRIYPALRFESPVLFSDGVVRDVGGFAQVNRTFEGRCLRLLDAALSPVGDNYILHTIDGLRDPNVINVAVGVNERGYNLLLSQPTEDIRFNISYMHSII